MIIETLSSVETLTKRNSQKGTFWKCLELKNDGDSLIYNAEIEVLFRTLIHPFLSDDKKLVKLNFIRCERELHS